MKVVQTVFGLLAIALLVLIVLKELQRPEIKNSLKGKMGDIGSLFGMLPFDSSSPPPPPPPPSSSQTEQPEPQN